MKIKAGYRLTVTSWENDADNYRTVSVDGLSEEHCRELVRLCELLYSRHRDRKKKTYGNLINRGWREDDEYGEFMAAAISLFDFDRIFRQQEEEGDSVEPFDEEAKGYYISDLLHELGLSSETFATRVVETIEVSFTPTDVELDDVTSKFVSTKTKAKRK